MTMPRYVVNMQEGVPYLLPKPNHNTDDNVTFKRGYQRCKGLCVTKQESVVEWIIDRPAIITGVGIYTQFGQLDKPNCLIGNNIQFYIDNQPIFQDKPLIDIEDYTNYRGQYEVSMGTVFKVEYEYNIENSPQIVWVDIDYVADPILQDVDFVIMHDDKEIKRITQHLSKGHYRIQPPQIKGYIPYKQSIEFEVNPFFQHSDNYNPIEIQINYYKFM